MGVPYVKLAKGVQVGGAVCGVCVVSESCVGRCCI